MEARGILFIEPGDDVYPGMVIGEHSKEGDLEVNPTKQKHLTNVRQTSKEENVQLVPAKKRTLEEFIAYVKRNKKNLWWKFFGFILVICSGRIIGNYTN